MNWHLKSGRTITDSPEFLCLNKDGSLSQSGLSSIDGRDYPGLRPFTPLTQAERREIADEVIAMWNRWADAP